MVITMTDYKSMYYHLAGRIAGTVEALEAITEKLKLSQQATEDMFINSGEEPEENNPNSKNI